ncbi:MAG: methionine adenosyltransferase domain-containing protein [Patescibacteria group bacterium]|jgi:S-adenosylmethionine synthetase
MKKTVEIPLPGHPDKVCDLIVDSILDEYLRRDAKSLVDIQALGSHGMLMIGGTVESQADFDCGELAKSVYARLGYEDQIEPFVNIKSTGHPEEKNDAHSVSHGTSIVHGYASRETREMLPRVLVYANALAQRIDDLRRTSEHFHWMNPDGKVQLTMDGHKFTSVVAHVQHKKEMDVARVQQALLEQVIIPVLGTDEGVKIFVNTAGKFFVGGFEGSSGASGRRLLSDTYGSLLPSGGAYMAGRDPSHPSRAGAYMARYVAKNLVHEGVAGNIFLTVAYTIGQAEPIYIEARSGDGKDLSEIVKKRFDFRPDAIVERLHLREPLYARVVAFGQFGRVGMPWEALEE